MTASTVPDGTDTSAGSSAVSSGRLTREERRRRTEAAILDAARELFAELGFEKTTIRGVASRAGIDPALVMQYYGSKEGLFAASAKQFADRKRMVHATLDEIPITALRDLFASFEDPEHRQASEAVMRNCLTHERARDVMRDQVMLEFHKRIAETIGGPDAELRAGLLAASMMGLSLARYLIELPSVAGASREDVERVMGPALRALVDPPA